jgi:DinB family protein
MDRYAPLALTPEIDDFRARFEELSTEADGLVAPLSDEQFAWQPAPDRWSVGQCLDHLNATARVYLPVLDEGIAEAIRRGLYAPGPYSYNWVGRLFVYLNKPNSRFRARAPRAFHPAPVRRRQDIVAAFRAYQVQYVDRLRQANGLDLGRARVASPVAQWLRLPLGSGFALMITHERRHLAQARRLLTAPGFPR